MRKPANRPRPYHHGDLANALAREARLLVEEHGAEAFSLREAAERCGVAVSSAYKHFASKHDLLQAVAAQGFDELADRIERRVRKATQGLSGPLEVEERLVEMGRTYILFALERPHLFRLLYGGHGLPGGDRELLRSESALRVTRLLLGALHGVRVLYGRSGANLELSMVTAWAGVHGFSMMVLDGLWKARSKAALDETISELGQSVLRSLRQLPAR